MPKNFVLQAMPKHPSLDGRSALLEETKSTEGVAFGQSNPSKRKRKSFNYQLGISLTEIKVEKNESNGRTCPAGFTWYTKDKKSVALVFSGKSKELSSGLHSSKDEKISVHSLHIQQMNAIRESNLEKLTRILDQDQDGSLINMRDRKTGKSPLILALQIGNWEIIELLLARVNLDVNAKTKEGIPLRVAVEAANTREAGEKLRILLSHPEINTDQIDGSGNTVLMVIVKKGSVELIKICSDSQNKNKCNPNIPDAFGITPLFYAISKSHSPMVDALLSFENIDPNLMVNGQTPLTYTVRGQHIVKIVEALLKRGADVNQVNTEGKSPLQIAFETRNLEAQEILLKQPALEISAIDHENDSLLMKALEQNIAAAKILLDFPSIAIPVAALEWAIKKNKPELLQSFLTHKNFSFAHPNFDASALLKIAKRSGSPKIINMLSKHAPFRGLSKRVNITAPVSLPKQSSSAAA